MKTKAIAITLGAAFLAASCGQSPKKEASYLDTLLLKDYKPVPCMNLPEHHPHSAKFKVYVQHMNKLGEHHRQAEPQDDQRNPPS